MLIQLLIPYPLTSSSAQFYVHSFFSSVSKQSQKPNAVHNNEGQNQNSPKTYETTNNNNNKKNAPAKQNKESKKKKEKSWSLFCGACPGVCLIYPVTLHWRKCFLLLVNKLQLAFWLGIVSCVHLSSHCWEDPVWLDLVHSDSLCELMCASVLLCLEYSVHLEPSISQASITASSSA